MNLVWLIYFAGLVERVDNALSVVFVIALITLFVSGIMMGINSDQEYISEKKVFELTKSIAKKSAILILILFIPGSFLPSKQTVYMMAAVAYGKEISEKPEVKVLGDKVYNLLNQKLDELIGEKK